MKNLKSHLRSRGSQHRGFALVVTLSLMILITVVAVGLLSLSIVSLRTSSQGIAQSEARANARLALMLAIGELQRQTGPDTRVTARADVLVENNPPILGTWKSWEGTDHETSGAFAGRPVSPGDYIAKKKARFGSWLVSGNSTTLSGVNATVPDTSPGATKITLVGSGSVGKDASREKLQVHLLPSKITVSSKRGAFAWWVGGENQKAHIPKPYKPTNTSVAGWSVLSKSHTVADTKPFRMDALLANATPTAKAISLRQTDLIVPKQGDLPSSSEFFHDLSTSSVGLLTNTATGGWRKDFSLLTENWASVSKTDQPFFRVTPGNDISFNIPKRGTNHRPDKSLLYPWSAYLPTNTSQIVAFEQGAVSSWENLKDWATLYKSMAANGTKIANYSTQIDPRTAAGDFDYLHKVRIIPIMARVQWVFSYWARPSPPTTPPAPSNTFQPCLLVTPVITLWNPYNVEIKSTPLTFTFLSCLPNAFRYTVNGVQNTRYYSIAKSENHTGLTSASARVIYQLGESYTFKPGESLLFSPNARGTISGNQAETLSLKPGYKKDGGHFYPIKNSAGVPYTGLVGSARIGADAKFNSTFADGATIGVGVQFDIGPSEGLRHLIYRAYYTPENADAIYPPITGLAGTTMTEASASPQPFLTTIFGARTASKTHLATKGLVQTSPLTIGTAMDGVGGGFRYPGTRHPVNSPFDYSFAEIGAAGDSNAPNTDTANRGFIVTGFQSGDGLSRCILAELPTKPIQSLAELQNWNIRGENTVPPYAFNIIGNSDATPLIPANAVYNSSNSSEANRDLQHDDFYCANHILFDDWFVSSIAPKSANLGSPSGSENLKKTFTDFVSGIDPLPNRAYHSLRQDSATAQTTGGSDKLFTDHANKADSWKSIASRIEVEGMFNVNSTSVTAWRALLGHARDSKTPYATGTGNTLSGEEDYAFSRFAVAGDTEAKSIGSSGGFSTSAEFAGYRKFDGPVLDRFAEEIVKQIRTRGPFLSLAEFVNRQLSSGDLALAGTIQAALNALAKDSSINPYAVIEGRSKLAVADPIPAGTAGYRFPAAALGYNAYGLPGWTRQADVLRPIAPILSARDDTFTIRAYGDARDANDKIIARAICEATVRRTRDYVNTADAADITTLPTSAINNIFGRRYQLISFRWLTNPEI